VDLFDGQQPSLKLTFCYFMVVIVVLICLNTL